MVTTVVRRALALSCVALVFAGPAARAAGHPDHVVIVTIPGFAWDVFARAPHPRMQELIDTGAVAAVSIRSVTKGSTPVRGYLTLGAGNRAYALTEPKPRRDEQAGQVALRAADHFENGTAAQAMARRVVRPRAGGIVVPDVPALDADQRELSYGTKIGALGEALVRTGVKRAVVIAGDESSTKRRSAALGLVDYSGTIDTGDVDGLLRPNADAADGVETDPVRFGDAVRRALDTARVVLVDPGETLRADEFAMVAAGREAAAQKIAAMQRTDALVGRVADLLGPRDTLYVVGISSPLDDQRDHLTLAVAHGAGIQRGWLTSPTTHRPGQVTLTDFAPTVLASVDVPVPSSMSGTPIRAVASGAARDRVAELAALDRQTSFGDRFQGVVAKLVVVLLAAVAAALAMGRRKVMSWLALAVLAVPPIAYADRVVPVVGLGIVGASAVTVAMVAVLATMADRLRSGALILVGLAFAITTGDLLAGAPLQVNNVFGYSPISAGRFYGNSNIAFAVLIATTLIGVFGVLELTRAPRIRVWSVAVLVGVVALQGLPQFGADFGGVAASVPAMLVAYAVARGRGLRLWRIAAWAAAGAAAAIGVTVLDLTRPPAARTHLGRFAADLVSGHGGDVVTRKIQSNIGLLGSAWTLTVPIALVVFVLLLRGKRDVLRTHRMLTAGLAGTLAAGVVGFAVNDTGIWVLGMTLAYVVPMAVILEGGIGSSDGRTLVQRPTEAAGRRGEGGP